jgi:cyanate permease
MFRPAYWWMPAFLLVRRLLLVALLVTDRSPSVWIWLTAANFSLLALHLVTEPYQRPRDNRMEAVSLLALSCMTTLRGVWPLPEHSAALSVAFNSLLIGPLLPLLLLLAMDRYREFKQSAGSVRATVVALLELW